MPQQYVSGDKLLYLQAEMMKLQESIALERQRLEKVSSQRSQLEAETAGPVQGSMQPVSDRLASQTLT